MIDRTVFRERRGVPSFVLGCLAVTIGGLLHVPMYWMGKDMGFVLADMPMDDGMIFGMVLIVAGIGVAAYGLLPTKLGRQLDTAATIAVVAPEDARLSPAHFTLMAALVMALVIDVMKPASLGFIMPGMTAEYGVSKAEAALVPFFALTGTVVGSVLWGVLSDVYGRKASILLSAVVFVGTSICGAMPSLAWNMFMCFLMGAGAGGMLPVTYALLAETMPSRHRGWALVLVGGLGAVGGYFAASALSALLVPDFSWRILWLANLPTGIILILMGGMIPESAKFLLARGRIDEARKVMARFGTTSRKVSGVEAEEPFLHHGHHHTEGSHDPGPSLWTPEVVGKTIGLSVLAVAWGLINFGLLLWLPADLVSKGYSMGVSSRLLAESALIAFPTVFVCAFIYSRWSTKWSLVATILVTQLGLIGVLLLDVHGNGSPVLPVALLIIGSNGIIAILLPYVSEIFPLKVRGRATGWVAACSKAGGLIAQGLSISALVPPLGIAAVATAVPMLVALALIAWFGIETRGLDLRRLERPLQRVPAGS
ncbi:MULTISPECIES: MFS transporter [unclassified Mesorhizobium]|uniref:MFS transporter n=1 Tax=unclassified Mesorhizobium TaxID=325217 RepID=UPI001929459F|nr:MULTISPECIES: MFS transporter [unclassified Mesorhizobium]